MHIIALASYLSTQRGGLERSLFDVCQQLSIRGYKITLVYEEGGDQLKPYSEFCDRLIQINSYKVNFLFLKDILKIPIYHDSLIYSNQYNNFFFGSSLSFLRKSPFVAHLRLHASTETGFIKKKKQAITLSQINRYIAISQAVKINWSTTLDLPTDKIDIVYNGIDTKQFTPINKIDELRKRWGIEKHEKVISYVGRIEIDKGIESLIRAFSLLLKTGVVAKLLIAGKPLFSGEDYQRSLEKLAQEEGIDQQVRFLGHLSDARSVYQLSNVNVLPSLWLEAFGRVVIESMACGTPCLGSCVGGIPEILTGKFNHWLFTPGDEYDLFTKLKNTILEQERDSLLAEKCRQHIIKKFSIEKTVDGIEATLHSMQQSCHP